MNKIKEISGPAGQVDASAMAVPEHLEVKVIKRLGLMYDVSSGKD